MEQYKKSKQASYEAMQKEWNYAINTLRDVEAENEKLKAEIEELKGIIALLNIQYTYLPYELREKIKSLSP